MYNIIYNKKIFIIIVVLSAVVILAGVLVYFFIPKDKIIFFKKSEKPTSPYLTPMSVLDPLGATAGIGEPKIEYFEK